MRMRSLILVALAACVGAGSGCGTMVNLASPKPLIYGGLAQDMKFLENPPHFHEGSAKGEMIALVLLSVLVPTEICCTAVLDTLTLPITVALDNESPPADKALQTTAKPPSDSVSPLSPEQIYSTDRRPVTPP